MTTNPNQKTAYEVGGITLVQIADGSLTIQKGRGIITVPAEFLRGFRCAVDDIEGGEN